MKFENIIAIGDIHGDINEIISYQKFYDLKNTLFLQCGDFGIGFKHQYKELATLDYHTISLKSRNNFIYTCRGNHDNPEYFTGKYDTSNIKLIPDYTVMPIETCQYKVNVETGDISEYDNKNISILFIGGAISIDRTKRISYADKKRPDVDYWNNESVILDEDKLKDIKDIDIVVTHTAPQFCYPIFKSNLQYWFNFDPTLEDDIIKERQILTTIYDQLAINSNIKYWCYGHFHYHNIDNINNTKFILLDINDFYTLTF